MANDNSNTLSGIKGMSTKTVQLIVTGQQGKLLQQDSHGGQIQTQDGAVRWYHISEYTYHLD